jgi:hypothetical protein
MGLVASGADRNTVHEAVHLHACIFHKTACCRMQGCGVMSHLTWVVHPHAPGAIGHELQCSTQQCLLLRVEVLPCSQMVGCCRMAGLPSYQLQLLALSA